MSIDIGQAPAESSHTAPASSGAGARGDLQSPHTAQGPDLRFVQRVLTVKLDLDRDTWRRLRELAWQAMRYRNLFLRARWAEAAGLRVDPAKGDPHDLTKHVRREEKGELSGAAYSAAEREVQGVWTRDGRRILAGAPLSEWSQDASLSVRGHKVQAESGIRIEQDGARFVAVASVQAQDQPGGCWLRLPIAAGTEIDRYQAAILLDMLAWHVPIAKATISFKPARGQALIRLTYALPVTLPPLGDRVATIGPIADRGRRLTLRTEMDTLDYTHKLTRIREIKDRWDGMRRRVTAQIGRRHGSARLKRRVLSRISTQDRLTTYVHQWSREVVDWCHGQGVGTIVLAALGSGDWPARQFSDFVRYKAAAVSITVTDEASADMADASTRRAVTAAVKREQKAAKRVNDALRTIKHEYREELGR